MYTFHVTFDHEEAVQGIAEVRRVIGEYQTLLASVETLDPIPFEWRHLTSEGDLLHALPPEPLRGSVRLEAG